MASIFSCRACLHALRREQRSSKNANAAAKSIRSFSSGPSRISNLSIVQSGQPASCLSQRLPYRQPATRWSSTSATVAKPTESSKEPTKNSKNVPETEFVLDYKGNPIALAEIPEDTTTLSWRSPEWTWGVTERLFEDCEQAKVTFELEDYVDEEDGKTKKRVKLDDNGMHAGHGTGWWFEEIGLPQTFNSYAMVCFLHMWILKVRLRQWPKSMSDHLSKMLSDHFFWRAEEMMDFVHKMSSQERHKHMDHYFQVWTGALIAYDEGLVKGDAVLATAIWRLLFQGDKDVDPLKIELVTRYARREIARLGWLEDKVIMKGYVGFGEPVKSWEAEYKPGTL